MIQPIRTPPKPTQINFKAACVKENTPVSAAAIAKRYATSAVASLTRLSPSRMVTTLRGTPSLRVIAVAADASGGETIAPRINPIDQGIEGIRSFMPPATVTVVNKTKPTARREIGRLLALKSRHDVK